jgi:hypothetical protein
MPCQLSCLQAPCDKTVDPSGSFHGALVQSLKRMVQMVVFLSIRSGLMNTELSRTGEIQSLKA